MRIGINGFGRIGRCVTRALYASGQERLFSLVAINDLGPVDALAHLLRYDSTHGRFPGEVKADGDTLAICGETIQVCAEREPSRLPWKELGVSLVLECTGLFTKREQAARHLDAGADRVLVSAPTAGADLVVVYGVNHEQLRASHQVVSNASCTTNCLAPLAWVLHRGVGIDSGLMTTVHSYTNDQPTLDILRQDLRRARGAAQSMIPTTTGAAAAVASVLPELAGKLDGYAVRVPTPNVSLVDFTFTAARETSVDEIDALMRAAAADKLAGILMVADEPLVSSDYNHNPASSIYDAVLTRVVDGRLGKVVSWYDNEWGFANRMLDTARAMSEAH